MKSYRFILPYMNEMVTRLSAAIAFLQNYCCVFVSPMCEDTDAGENTVSKDIMVCIVAVF